MPHGIPVLSFTNQCMLILIFTFIYHDAGMINQKDALLMKHPMLYLLILQL